MWTCKSDGARLDVNVDSTLATQDVNVPPSTRGLVLTGGKRIALTARELSLFRYLQARYRTWVTAAELLAAVCDCPQQRDSTLIRVHLSAVRRKLGPYGYLIESRRTYGYRWVGAPDEP
jgi:DNA-binding response OmpR family regulator